MANNSEREVLIKEMCKHFEYRKLEKFDVIFEQNEEPDYVYFLVSGSIQIL